MRRSLLAILLVLVAAGSGVGSAGPDPDRAADPDLRALPRSSPDGETVRRSIAAAARFLWSRQASDGGWHSATYGLLRSGQSLTPFVLVALLDVPQEIHGRDPAAVARALAFLRRQIGPDGALGTADPQLADYPNYATALAVRALAGAGAGADAARSVSYLRGMQLADALGWQPAHPAYGAWGMGGSPRRPPEPGHLDISMTRHVLEGLRAGGAGPGDPAFAKAAEFLRRCQNPDGGFFFSTVVVYANKAGRDGERYRSYGTATADGLLSLAAMGVPRSDPRVRGALRWLAAHHRRDAVPGFQDDAEENWREGMVYYYLAASAQVLRRHGVREAPAGHDWRAEMRAELLRRQRPGGEWVNASFLMKEDDPLIATRLALTALLATYGTS